MQKNFWKECYYRWDYYVKKLKQQDDLDEKMKSRALGSMEVLKKIFDEGWMKESLLKHPLFGYIANMAPWSRRWIIDFGEKLREFGSRPTFGEIKKRLRNSKEYGGAKTELDVAWIIKRNGFKIEFLPRGEKRSTDFKIEILGRGVYIEATGLATSMEEKRANECYRALLYPIIYDHEVHLSFNMHKTLKKPEVRGLQEEMREAIQKAKKMKRCVKIEKPNIIDFFVCPREKLIELKEWEKEKNPLGGCSGPPIKVDEVRRTRNKIRKKIRQTPQNKPSIIVIDARNTSIWGEIEEYWNLANQIDQTVCVYPNLLAGVVMGPLHIPISGDSSAKRKKTYRMGNYTIHSKMEFGEALLVIKNRCSRFAELRGRIDKLFNGNSPK